MLDVHRLMLLRELSIRGTMAAVAESLQYSPSAVSQQLTQLEREAGTPLLRKSGRGVRLTPEAEILVAAAAKLADTLERAEAEVKARFRDAADPLRMLIVTAKLLTGFDA